MSAMRVLFSSWPAHGHLLPMLPLARAAERAGHDVVVASGAEGVAEAARRGLATWDVGPSRAESNAIFGTSVPDVKAIPAERRMATTMSRMFGGIATHRAADLVPRVEAWAPDLVVHPITELAASVAAARTGARHVVHSLGPLPSETWSWLSAPFGELCDVWGVPALADEMVDRPYLDTCPPSLQEDAVSAFRDRRLLRPSSGEVLPGERLPWDDARLAALPFEHTVHLTLGTIFNGLTDVFQTALAGLAQLPVNVLVTVGPWRRSGQPRATAAARARHRLRPPRARPATVLDARHTGRRRHDPRRAVPRPATPHPAAGGRPVRQRRDG